MEKEFRLKDLFSQEEIQLLYHACLSYGENLAEANKKIHGCPGVSEQLDTYSKAAYSLAVRLANGIEE